MRERRETHGIQNAYVKLRTQCSDDSDCCICWSIPRLVSLCKLFSVQVEEKAETQYMGRSKISQDYSLTESNCFPIQKVLRFENMDRNF